VLATSLAIVSLIFLGGRCMDFPIEKIEAMIYTIRGQRVMLDSDLAKLYGVETRTLNQAVKRNQERFPDDFMIEPNSSELAILRSQFVILEGLTVDNPVYKHVPRLFTENGVAMLSTVLKSKNAIQVNIAIMRTFTKLRSFLAMENSNESRISDLETGIKNTNKLFKIVFERLNTVEENINPKLPANRKKIGLKRNTKD
jgi:hypothetical protein